MGINKTDDTERLLRIAAAAAVKAGRAIMDFYGRDDLLVNNKEDNSPVTSADILADRIINSLLKESELPVMSEEGRQIPYKERRMWQRFWLVDPLDGTREFIDGSGEFTVNIALIEKQSPLAGVVYAPVNDLMYAGIAGIGAWRFSKASEVVPSGDSGDKRPAVAVCSGHVPVTTDHARPCAGGPEIMRWLSTGVTLPCVSKKGYSIVASRSFPDERSIGFIGEFCIRYSDTRVVHRGSSLKLCMVAEGEADIYPRFSHISEWDTAAGHAIVKASGGCVVQAQDMRNQLIYNKKESRNPWFIAVRDRALLGEVREMVAAAII